MNIVFLLGAGASFGSGECYPQAPALGAHLFAELRKQSIVLRAIRGAARERFDAGDFEGGMVQLREHADEFTTPMLREMAIYFAQFWPGPKNLYHRLLRGGAASRHIVSYATTNYDLLLESAASRAKLGLLYWGTVARRGSILLHKLHGGIQFVIDLPPGFKFDVTFTYNAQNMSGPPRILDSAQEVVQWLQDNPSVAPSMSVYAPGKHVLFERQTVDLIQRDWAQRVASASLVYIIGLRVTRGDEHIWGVLARCAARLRYVGATDLDRQDFRDWASDVGISERASASDGNFAASMPEIEVTLAKRW